MRKFLRLSFMIFSASLFLNACKKNSVDEQYTETVKPITPDLTTPVNASVTGFITDENGAALKNATVKAGAFTAITDTFGYFKISGATFAKSSGFVEVTKDGYFTGYRTFLPVAEKETYIRLQLITKTISGNINAATGGAVNTLDGAVVSLPANSVVIASNNTAYSGIVNVSMHWLNPADPEITQQIMPGDLRGIDSSGYLNSLTTYGMMVIELTGSTGEKLQVANGMKASLSFPIPASLQSTAPASIPLWYFNEANGLWKEDGVAIKNGNSYKGEVTHFTYWNCDVPQTLVNFNAQVVDMTLQPLSNIGVSVTISGVPNSTRTSYTDVNGQVTGMIPANSSLDINLLAPCNQSIFVKNIQTTNSDVNAGSIKIDPQQYAVTFKGIVNKCDGTPVTDGYVIIAGGGNNKVINLLNGVFNASGLVCPNSSVSVVAVDRANSQQSIGPSTTLVPGLNDFGTLSACNPVTVEGITYTLDGVTKTLSLPQHLFNGDFNFATNTTTINAVDLLNGSIVVFNLTFSGTAAPGTYWLGNTINLSQEYQLSFAQLVTISAYGLIGEFISGSFNNVTMMDSATMTTHTFSCTFNIKRDS